MNRVTILFVLLLLVSSTPLFNTGASAFGSTTTLTEKAALALFPGGSALANDIPLEFLDASSHAVRRYQAPILYGDVDGDGRTDAVVAYYTKPHSQEGENGQTNEAFFHRSHVAVIEIATGKRKVKWDSEGWGSHIRGGFDPSIDKAEKDQIANSFFALMDIDGDGTLDIVAMRASYLAMGDLFVIWTWNGKGFVELVSTGATSYVVQDKQKGIAEIHVGRNPNDKSDPYVLRWDASKKRFERNDQ